MNLILVLRCFCSNASGSVCPSGPSVHKHQYSSHAVTDINLDNVCKKGSTLLWDLVQDEDAVNTHIRTRTHTPLSLTHTDSHTHTHTDARFDAHTLFIITGVHKQWRNTHTYTFKRVV